MARAMEKADIDPDKNSWYCDTMGGIMGLDEKQPVSPMSTVIQQGSKVVENDENIPPRHMRVPAEPQYRCPKKPKQSSGNRYKSEAAPKIRGQVLWNTILHRSDDFGKLLDSHLNRL